MNVYSFCFDALFKTATDASLPRTFVVTLSYFVRGLLLFNS